jgi:hypothetical protein
MTVRGALSGIPLLVAAIVLLPAGALAGLEVLTRSENDTIAKEAVVIRLRGDIAAPMARDLRDLWSGLRSRYRRVLLDLDTPGGSLAETEEIIAVIATMRSHARVDTVVGHGALCASACVAIFVQGERRLAGGASVWLFHGACYDRTNLPSLSLTHRFLDILRQAGVSDGFLCHLVDKNYVTAAGKLWLSGYELFHVHQANVITELIESWRPEAPDLAPRDPLIGPR